MPTGAGLATVVAGFVAIATAAFGSGVALQKRRDTRQEMREEHRQVIQAHNLLHKDIDRMFNRESQLPDTSTYTQCPVCASAETYIKGNSNSD